jgi:hypothetical protein
MNAWIADSWWWVWPVASGVAFFAYLVHRRGGTEPLPQRILYSVVPVLDPTSEDRRRLPIRLLLVGIGVVIAIVALGIVELITS